MSTEKYIYDIKELSKKKENYFMLIHTHWEISYRFESAFRTIANIGKDSMPVGVSLITIISTNAELTRNNMNTLYRRYEQLQKKIRLL